MGDSSYSSTGEDASVDRRFDTGTEFAAVPRLALDTLLAQMIEHAKDIIGAQGRLHALIHANGRIIASDLGLDAVLRRVAEVARELLRARYAALGVLSPGGHGLEQFIHVGIDSETAARIGHLPEGKGLLGALIDDPRAIRLTDLTADVRSVGFPESHPPMTSFLGVPIRIREEIYGNLYLADSEDGEFSQDDQELATALAATAATAIDNARLYDEAKRRQQWLAASAEITRTLLSVDADEPALQTIARRLHDMAAARIVTIVIPNADEQLTVAAAYGDGAEELTGTSYPAADTLSGTAVATGRPILINDAAQQDRYVVHLADVTPVGPILALPLISSQRTRGAVLVGRAPGQRGFSEAESEMADTFAQHAAVALELADARAEQQRLMLFDDRDRIARDLHDHVIQKLFAAGLALHSTTATLGSDHQAAARLSSVVEDIDDTIRQIRTSIFQLRGPLGPEKKDLRTRIAAVVVDEMYPLLGFSPELRFSGPLDHVVPDEMFDDLLAVIRECLTNIARHAKATQVLVQITARQTDLSIDVIDNGIGIGETQRRSGLANLARRAELYGGTLTFLPHDGTHLRWTASLA